MTERPATRSVAPEDRLPLCVDLDGTLIKADVLVESLLIAGRSWHTLQKLPPLLAAGRAGLKEGLAGLVRVDCGLFAYDGEVVAFLRKQKAAGRRLILVTATNHRVAVGINMHLGGLFDELMGSDGQRNLRGAEKARALVERFGERGFVYIGNDRTDLEVWRRAESAMLVGAPAWLIRRVSTVSRVERVFSSRPSILQAAIREIRPQQWLKNLLVFVPIVTSGDFGNGAAWLGALAAFLAFSAAASSIYIINDLFDLEADRKHPRKCHRPLASGAMPLMAGIAMIPILFSIAVGFSLLAGMLPYVLAYAAMSIVYSMKLKKFPLIDVFLLAALYTLRLFAGGIVTGHQVSLWLLAFSCFLFLGLAVMKRVTELDLLKEQGPTQRGRRAYMPSDILILVAFGTNATFVSSMVLALYVQSDTAAATTDRPEALWWIVPLMLFWQCRLWFATSRGYMTDDPIVFATKDWVSAVVALGVLVTMFLGHATL